MSEVIVITSGKGGVGKTTTVANIGTGLAMLGKKVVVVDTDIGLRNLDVVLGLENRIVYNLVDVINGSCRLRQALIKDKRHPELCLLPSAQTKDKSAVSPEQMIKLTDDLREQFDYILLDCPAGIEQGFKNAIAGADKALVVTTPEVSAIRDADRIIGLLEANEIRDISLIINRLRPDMIARGDMMSVDDVTDILAVDLIGTILDDEQIVIATNQGEPLSGKSSQAEEEYMNFCKRLLGEEYGFIGCVIIVLLLLAIAFECIRMSLRAKDLSGKVLCCGIGGLIALQSFINICVATGLAPNTGTPLPFVSYGLTSLVSLYIGMGLVLNVGLQSSTYNKEIIQKEIDRREDYL